VLLTETEAGVDPEVLQESVRHRYGPNGWRLDDAASAC